MTFHPGSFAWLLAHDLRLSRRQLTEVVARWSAVTTTGFVVVSLVVMHALAWGALSLRASTPGLFGPQAVATAAIGALLWMIAQGLLGATRSLYERGSLELLFASPLPAWKAVASRALSIAATSFAAVAPLLLPLANIGAIQDGSAWLSIYPILVAMAMFGTAVGLMIAIALFAAAGARRARTISQIMAAIIAGGFVLIVQIGLLLPKEMTAEAMTWLGRAQHWLTQNSGDIFVCLQAAAQGDVLSLANLLLVCAVIFIAAVAALSGAFATACQTAAGSSADPLTAHGARGASRFRAGPGPSLRLKEWRLLTRDPNLFAQLGLQIIYTLPLAVLLLRSPHDIPPAIALTPLIVVLAAQISASLAWITVSGEDAPEVIATAPIPATQSALAKLSAIAIPLAVILAVPIFSLAVIAPAAAMFAVGFSALAASSTALLNFWHPLAGNRRSLLRRHSQSKVIAIAEHGLALLWAVTVVTAMVDPAISMVPLAVIACVLWLFVPKSKGGHSTVKLFFSLPRVHLASASSR